MRKKKIFFISAYFEKGGAEKVFRDAMQICKEYFEVGCFVPSGLFFTSLSLFVRLISFSPANIHVHNYHSPMVFLAVILYRSFFNRNCKIAYTAHDHRIICPESYYGKYVDGMLVPYAQPPTEWEKITHNHSNKNAFINVTKKLKWFFWFRFLQIHQCMDIVFTPSEYLKEQILKDKVGRRLNVQLLINPSSSLVCSLSQQKKDSLRPIRMVFLGRLSFEKGLVEFIDLLNRLDGFDYLLDIYGTGKMELAIESKISELGLSNRIYLKGSINPSNVPSVLVQYDMLVLPSICNEIASLVLVEGALAGLNLLTVNYGGAKETAELCGGYFLFNPKDPSSLRKAFVDYENAFHLGAPRTFDKINWLKRKYSGQNYLSGFMTAMNELD